MKAPLLALALAFLVVLIVFSGLVEAADTGKAKIKVCNNNYGNKFKVYIDIVDKKTGDWVGDDSFTVGKKKDCGSAEFEINSGNYWAIIEWRNKDTGEKGIDYESFYVEPDRSESESRNIHNKNIGMLLTYVERYAYHSEGDNSKYSLTLYANGEEIGSSTLSSSEMVELNLERLNAGRYDLELKWKNEKTGTFGTEKETVTIEKGVLEEINFEINDKKVKKNSEPIFDNPGTQSGEPGKWIYFKLNGYDPDGDSLSWSTSSRYCSINQDGYVSCIFYSEGTYEEWFDVDDSRGNSYMAAVTFNIRNSAPSFQNPWITGSDSFIVQNLKEGDKITFYYTITNPNSYDVSTTLGATIRHEDWTEYYDEGNDRDVTLKPGINSVDRSFVISNKVKPGRYNYLLGIHKAHIAGELSYTSWTDNYPITVIPKITCNSGYILIGNVCIQQKINSVRWDKNKANTGEDVNIVVETQGIYNDYINLEIWEWNKIYPNTYVTTLKVKTNSDGLGIISWKAEWRGDGLTGGWDPEYYVVAKYGGISQESSLLDVTKTCSSNDFKILGKCLDISFFKNCLGTTDDVTLGSVGTNLACNVIPIVELGPDAVDTGKCLFNNNKDGWDETFCKLTYVGDVIDIGSNGALILSFFGGPAIIAGVAVEASADIPDSGIAILKNAIKIIKKDGKIIADVGKNVWNFIKSFENLKLLLKTSWKIGNDFDTIGDLFKLISKDPDRAKSVLKTIDSLSLSETATKGFIKLSKTSSEFGIEILHDATISLENVAELFTNGKLSKKIEEIYSKFKLSGDLKRIKFVDKLTDPLGGSELGRSFDDVIELALSHKKYTSDVVKEILIKNTIVHESSHIAINNLVDDDVFGILNGQIEEYLVDIFALKKLNFDDKKDFIEAQIKVFREIVNDAVKSKDKASLVKNYAMAKKFSEEASNHGLKAISNEFVDQLSRIKRAAEESKTDLSSLEKSAEAFSKKMDIWADGLGTSSNDVKKIANEVKKIGTEAAAGRGYWPAIFGSGILLTSGMYTAPQPEVTILDAPSAIKSDDVPKIKVAFVNNGTDAQSGSITVNVENVADLKIISHDTTEIKTNVVGSSISVEAKEAGWASSEEKTLELELKPKDVSKDIKITLSSEADGIKFNDGKPLEPVIQIKSVEDALSPKEPVQPRTCIADDFDFKWSACVNGWQTGIYTKKIGSDCVNGEPDNAKQVCIYTPQQPEPAIPTTSSPTPAPSKQPATEPIKSELDLDKKMCVLSGGNVGSIFSGINDGAIYTKSECLQKFKSLVLDGGRLTCGLTIDNRPKITYRNVEWGGMIIQEDYCPLQDLSITKTDNQNQQSVGGGPIVSQQSTLQSASQPAQTPQLTPKQVQYGGKAKVKIYNSRSAVYRVKMDIMKDNAVVMTENLENKAFFETDWIDLDIGKYTVTVEWENKENGLKYKEKQELIIKNGMSRIAIFDIKDVLKKQEIVQQSQIEKLPDLIIEEIKLKKTTVKSGSYIPIQFAVKNVGEAAAKNIKLRISYLDSSIEKVLPEMQPGGFVMVLELIKLSAIGSYKIDVNVDPDNNIIESREDNKESVEVSVI